MKKRYIKKKLLDAMKVSPIVYLNGIRQSGKSTLAHHLIDNKELDATYVTFDNPTQMAAATSAPDSFLKSSSKTLIIDEVQMVPELFRALKIHVDELRLNHPGQVQGQFLLTGSANIMALPKLSNPLVGRMTPITLYPFSACEVIETQPTFLENLFSKNFSSIKNSAKLIDQIRLATFPIKFPIF